MFLIAGLGNSGLKYHNTKHNFGFLLADQIISEFNLKQQPQSFNSLVFSGNILDHKIIVVKPQNFINNSGSAVLLASQFYKILPENIIVLHDDLDLPLGKVKAKIGGGNGGHNGVRDIDQKIGNNYYRIRLGIGKPENKNYEIANYVLSKFNQEELQEVQKINRKICENFCLILQKKLPDFLNKMAL